MERKVVVVCCVVGFFGLLSAATGFFVEATRIMDSEDEHVSGIQCAYPELSAAVFGSTAALALVISHTVLNVSAGCICCRSPRFPDSGRSRRVALVCFILSWFTFVVAFLLLVTGVFFGIIYCMPGVFAVGAILALATSAFGIVYYLTLTAVVKNGTSYPNQEGITLGQPKIPQNSQDPVFARDWSDTIYPKP